MSSPVRVLIVAADPLARNALSALLRDHDALLVAGQAAASEDLAAVVAVYRPDVLLWDAGWDGAARADTFATVAEALPPFLAIAPADAAAALWAAGARGVVGRDVAAHKLAIALAAVAGDLCVFEPAQADAGEWTPPVAGAMTALVEPLTPREMDVLRAVADGLSNKLIARALDISEHTVKYHVNSILGKLDAQSRTDAVVRATRAGILLL